MRRIRSITIGLGVLVLALSSAGCNAFGIMGEDNEVRVTIEALGADFLDANDGFIYEVTSNTEYEGLNSFADLRVGDVVEIEWENGSGNRRRALEIEAGDHDEKGDKEG